LSPTFRAFIALPLTEPVLDVLLHTQERLRSHAERAALDLRWTRPEQLHVTVTFLGNVLRVHEPLLRDILREIGASQTIVSREISELGAFGPPARARVLHVPVPDGDGALRRLASRLADATVRLGVEREVRPYRPHVTLARFRSPGDARGLIRSVAVPITEIRFDRLHLYESRPGPDGSHYVLLAQSIFERPT
jgi:RNA 2',3'-cyclic 3'-phosphodiesterase